MVQQGSRHKQPFIAIQAFRIDDIGDFEKGLKVCTQERELRLEKAVYKKFRAMFRE